MTFVDGLARARRNRRSPTPLRVMGRGSLAGLAGMAVMGVVVKTVGALTEGHDEAPSDWSEAEPPAKFAHRFLAGVAHREVAVDHAGALNNLMHVLYAPPLGIWYGVVQESRKPHQARHALAFAASVWAARLTLNPLLRLKEPFWRDSLSRNVVDASFHLAFGVAVAGAYAELARRGV